MKWRKMHGGDYESEDNIYVLRWQYRSALNDDKQWHVWYRGRQLTEVPYKLLRDAQKRAERDRKDWEGTG